MARVASRKATPFLGHCVHKTSRSLHTTHTYPQHSSHLEPSESLGSPLFSLMPPHLLLAKAKTLSNGYLVGVVSQYLSSSCISALYDYSLANC